MEDSVPACSECGEAIPVDRLKARPDATLCVDCKTKLAKRPKITSNEKAEKVKKRKKGGNRGGVDLSRIKEIR